MTDVFDAGIAALRWVTDGAIAAEGGATWPQTRAPGAPHSDDLYWGTAGVLAALAEARLGGITEFDDHARAAAGRLRSVASAGAASMAGPNEPDIEPGQLGIGLYTGLSGCAASLRIWASVSGEGESAEAARAIAEDVAGITATGQPVSAWRDLICGEAGVILALIDAGDASVGLAVSQIADRIVAQADWPGGLPDWHSHADDPAFSPNFSHGAAGIGYALAVASTALARRDLLDVAVLAGQRLVRLGSRPDGTLAVPHSIPLADPQTPVSYGWCHGPTGTLRLFHLLDRLRPGEGWAGHVAACRQAVRASGLPARRYPGFWDNLGQCCGTAGVGEMALDRYQETGEREWLTWAVTLAGDVLDRRIDDAAGVRWSNTAHQISPPELEPGLGWMQGAAGIASWLLRLARVQRQGAAARRIRWPDRPPID